MKDNQLKVTQIQFEPEKSIVLDSHFFNGTFKLFAFRAKAFKAFKDTDWVTISKIVLFYGNNSAGKTAILEPLMLLKYGYDRSLSQEDVQVLWRLNPNDQEASYSDYHNVSCDSQIELSYKFISDLGNEAVLVYSFNESSESVILDYDGKQTNLDNYYDTKNAFFLELKNEDYYNHSLFQLIRQLMQTLKFFLKTLYSIDAHRIQPKRQYLLPGGKIGEINSEGLNTYETLLSNIRGDVIDNIDVNEWLEKFGYQLEWKSEGRNKGKFLLKDIDSKYSSNLADNGFGIGQSLPLIVRMANMKSGSLVVDSPEAFLQANMHGEMMDAIIKCVKNGNNVIIETGSEYMLFRLRRRLVEKKIDYDGIHIYFITDEGTGNSKCEEISISKTAVLSKKVKAFNEFFSSDFEDLKVVSTGRS